MEHGGQAGVVISPHRAKDEAEINHPNRPSGLELPERLGAQLALNQRADGKRAKHGHEATDHEGNANLRHRAPFLRHLGQPGGRASRAAEARDVEMAEQEGDRRRDQDHDDDPLDPPEPEREQTEQRSDHARTNAYPREIAHPTQARQQRAL